VRLSGWARACWWAAAPAVLIGAVATLACAPRRPAGRTLRVCADPNNLPFSNDKGQGFENELAALVARDMRAQVRYTFWPERRGFVRNTLGAGVCDVMMGAPTGFERVLTTAPYYRSTYVFVFRKDLGASIRSFDDAALKRLRIGVQVVGDDYENTPPARALARRGLAANVVGYTLYGDYSQANPAARIVDAVACREVDVAVVWGPFAGYFAPRQKVPLEVVPVSPQVDLPFTPFVFEIALGVERGNDALRKELDAILIRRRGEITSLLERYGVPLPPSSPEAASAITVSHVSPTVDRTMHAQVAEQVYVTNERSGTVTVIDAAEDRVVRTIAVEGRPRGIHVSSDGSTIYVAVSRSRKDGPEVREGILALDAASGRVLARYPVGDDPEDFAIDARPSRLYVANEDQGTASIADLPSGHVAAILPVGTEPEGVGISPDGRWVYVTAESSNTVSVIDARRADVVASFMVDSRPRRATFTPDGRLALVTAEIGATLSVVDVARHVVVGRYRFPRPEEHPVGVVTSPDGRHAYVATGRGGTVVVLDLSDPAHPKPVGEVRVGERAWGIALTADGRKLYTANGVSNDVTAIDILERRVVATIPAGDGPWGVSLGRSPAPHGHGSD
jgi:quinoprotein dehydrogenase-associated probable ABC transporter substrate-binding protein/PQQ-dependent catabolism-associated beta-propeller protein